MECKVVNIIGTRPNKFSDTLIYIVEVSTPYGVLEREYFGDVSVGDKIPVIVRGLGTRLHSRLERIGISITLIGNIPWVYLDSVNGVKVDEKAYAKHGYGLYSVGLKHRDGKFFNRKRAFEKIRQMVDKY